MLSRQHRTRRAAQAFDDFAFLRAQIHDAALRQAGNTRRRAQNIRDELAARCFINNSGNRRIGHRGGMTGHGNQTIFAPTRHENPPPVSLRLMSTRILK
jgi:hypothetical protein